MVIVKKYGADWCSHCMALSAQLKDTPLLCEVQSFDVDEMDDKEIDDLDIRSMPTCIIYNNDEEIKRFVDDYTPEDINNYLKENNLC